jgi:hypothetical protein
MRAGCWKALRRVVPAGANRRVAEEGSSDDARLLAHCIVEAATRCGGVDFVVANARESTDMGEPVVMRGCMEQRAPLPGPCQAFAANAAVPRIVSRGGRAVYLELILNERAMEACDMTVGGGQAETTMGASKKFALVVVTKGCRRDRARTREASDWI